MSTRTRKPRHPLLTAVRDGRDATREADLALVVSVVDWAAAHPDPDPDPDPECEDNLLGPTALALAGPGAPRVEDFELYELAATLGRTIESVKPVGRGHPRGPLPPPVVLGTRRGR